MSDVLTDEQRRALCGCDQNNRMTPYDVACYCTDVYEIESAVVAALAARSGVDVEALAANTAQRVPHYCTHPQFSPVCAKCVETPIADALRLALATAEARHEAELATLRAERDAALRRVEELAEKVEAQDALDKANNDLCDVFCDEDFLDAARTEEPKS